MRSPAFVGAKCVNVTTTLVIVLFVHSGESTHTAAAEILCEKMCVFADVFVASKPVPLIVSLAASEFKFNVEFSSTDGRAATIFATVTLLTAHTPNIVTATWLAVLPHLWVQGV